MTGNGKLDCLVVDDEDLMRELATQVLQRSGHKVETAGSPAEAIRCLVGRESRGEPMFHVALVDGDLGDGRYDAGSMSARLIEEVLRPRGLRVLTVSGKPRGTFTSYPPVDGFLMKPYKIADLIEAIELACV